MTREAYYRTACLAAATVECAWLVAFLNADKREPILHDMAEAAQKAIEEIEAEQTQELAS